MLAGTEFGADLGFEVSCVTHPAIWSTHGFHFLKLAATFAAVTYPPLRWLEIRYTGR